MELGRDAVGLVAPVVGGLRAEHPVPSGGEDWLSVQPRRARESAEVEVPDGWGHCAGARSCREERAFFPDARFPRV